MKNDIYFTRNEILNNLKQFKNTRDLHSEDKISKILQANIKQHDIFELDQLKLLLMPHFYQPFGMKFIYLGIFAHIGLIVLIVCINRLNAYFEWINLLQIEIFSLISILIILPLWIILRQVNHHFTKKSYFAFCIQFIDLEIIMQKEEIRLMQQSVKEEVAATHQPKKKRSQKSAKKIVSRVKRMLNTDRLQQ